jgi:hypothetical protein
MAERLFSFRWDIDHRACMTDGIPKVQKLCAELGVANTFFVNMGKSTNLREWLGKGLLGSRAKLKDMEAINLIEKIGWPRFILETALQRPVGKRFVPQLQSLQRDGHELGLHGGSDHVVWSRRFSELPRDFLVDDVGETLDFFTKHFGKPTGFTSPGFKSDERIMEIVEEFDFSYNGDAIGGNPKRATVGNCELKHWTIPVTICGPRTIPFLEWHGAKKTATATILDEFDKHLETDELVILYGHPCYEGIDIDLLRKVFKRALHRGFRFVTHAQIADRLNGQAITVN